MSLEEKRAAAIAWLGERWVLHPNYKFNPRHSWSMAIRAQHGLA